ncbi:hypothetical protein [Devosia riboflavina]
MTFENYSALRAYFDDKGKRITFIEGMQAIPDDVLHDALDRKLVTIAGGSGWTIHDSIVLTAKGRKHLGLPPLSGWQRFKSWVLD